MEGALTTADLLELMASGEPFSPGDVLEGDEMIESVIEVLRHNAHPDYVTVMAIEAVEQEYPGPDGFTEAWSDWLSPYAEFRFEIEEVLTLDDMLVLIVSQIARSGTTASRSRPRARRSGGSWTDRSAERLSISISRPR